MKLRALSKKQQGVSILELLVALFILAVGLLGVIALQAESLKLNQQAYSSTQALFLANEMAESMRADRESFTGGVVASNPQLINWQADVVQRLPGGLGTVQAQVGQTDVFDITITYNQQTLAAEGIPAASNGIVQVNYLLTVRI